MILFSFTPSQSHRKCTLNMLVLLHLEGLCARKLFLPGIFFFQVFIYLGSLLHSILISVSFKNTLLTTLFEIHINRFPFLILFCLYHLTVNGILYLFIVILLSSPEHKLYENKGFVLCLYSLLYCQHLE